MRKEKNHKLLFGLLFFILTVMDLYIYFRLNVTFTATDTLFHFSRVQEIYENLKHGSVFTWISSRYFQQTGVGSYIFYPDIFLYIWALLKFIFSPIKAFYIWVGLFIFLTYILSFYAMYSFSHSKMRSLFFSLIYTTVPYHLFLGLWNGTLGEFIAYTFLPLVFIGVYHIFWGDTNKWYLLAIGMTLILYCHLVSAFIIGLFLIILLLWKSLVSKSLTKNKLLSFTKAVIFTVLLTMPFWLLFFIEGSVATPTNSFIVLHDLIDIVNQSINNTIGSNIGIFLLVTAIIGLIFVKNNNYELAIYLIGVFFFIASSNIIPYQIFNHFNIIRNTLGLIQMPGRLLSFSSLFLAITASKIIENLLSNFMHKNTLISVALILSVPLFWSETLPQYKLLQMIPNLTSKSDIVLPGLKKVTDNNYHYMFNYIMPAGETDYYHKTSKLKHSTKMNETTKSIITHTCFINNKKTIQQPVSKNNQLEYKIKTSCNSIVDLPAVFYKDSTVTINNHPANKKMSKRGTILTEIKPGINYIDVGFKPPLIEYMLIMISIVGWIVLLFKIIRNTR